MVEEAEGTASSAAGKEALESVAVAHSNQGTALKSLGRLEEAIDSFNKAIALKPDWADAYNKLGLTLNELRRFDEAMAAYNKAIALKPDCAEAYNYRGVTLCHLRRYDEALASYKEAIALRSDYADAYINRGKTFNDLRRFDAALANFNIVIAARPSYAEAYYYRGYTLYDLQRFDEAMGAYDKAIALRPDYAEAYNNRGNTLNELRRYEEAMDSYDKAIALKPEYAVAYNNRGTALCELRRFEEAVTSCDKAIALKPDFAEAHCARGSALKELRRFDEAIACYSKAIALRPDLADAYYNRSQLNLLMGKLQDGWKDYEWRKFMHKPPIKRALLQPPLTSLDEIAGKSIFVHWEQGLGDTIQFSRYVELLQDAGARVLFAPQPNLQSLLAYRNSTINLVAPDDLSLSFDYHASLMSLPLVFATSAETVPSKVPYVFSDKDRVDKWRKRIGDQGFKIGICWQGNKNYIDDFDRSFSLSLFERISRLEGVRLISLHKGDGEIQLKTLPAGMVIETLGDDFDAGPDAFVDTAAVMTCLDLVLTADTAIAHLAGALGAKTWVALAYTPDWRWMLDREDSPWYPTMRLFRQTARGIWAGVFDQIRSALLMEFEKGGRRLP